MSDHVVEAHNLMRSYQGPAGSVDVLRGVTFAVRRGEFVAIQGTSGSGKTTLLNILGFLERPDGGTYRFDGADLSSADDDTLSAVRNGKIGFVFQHFNLIERATALRNVMLPLLYRDEEAADGEARAMAMLERVGMTHRAQHRASALSGGEQQRVAIARALINDPVLVLADEPTGNLDSATGAGILSLFSTLRADGTSLVLVTHDGIVAARADRVLGLEDGRVAGAPALTL